MPEPVASLAEATRVHRDIKDRFVRMNERRSADVELIARSRLAVSQSFATLARVPELTFVGKLIHPERTESARSKSRETATWSSRAWLGLEVRSDLRFFFDVDDGEGQRRDEIGVVLASEDDVPHEAKSILFDLAQAAIPEGRPRLFAARVRNRDGKRVYEGVMRMNPRPVLKRDHGHEQ